MGLAGDGPRVENAGFSRQPHFSRIMANMTGLFQFFDSKDSIFGLGLTQRDPKNAPLDEASRGGGYVRTRLTLHTQGSS